MTTLIFEKGKTKFEEFIMFLQMLKVKRKRLEHKQYFSHVKIVIDGIAYETHPRHGVIKNKFYGEYYSNTRMSLPIRLKNKEKVVEMLELLAEYENKYYRFGALCSGIYMLTGLWFGNRKPTKFYCSKLVALAIGMNKYWKRDMADILEHTVNVA